MHLKHSLDLESSTKQLETKLFISGDSSSVESRRLTGAGSGVSMLFLENLGMNKVSAGQCWHSGNFLQQNANSGNLLALMLLPGTWFAQHPSWRLREREEAMIDHGSVLVRAACIPPKCVPRIAISFLSPGLNRGNLENKGTWIAIPALIQGLQFISSLSGEKMLWKTQNTM